MNGLQFLDGKINDTPKHVYDSELHAEIDIFKAHEQIANLIYNFILDEDKLYGNVLDAEIFYHNLIDTLNLEGNSNVYEVCVGSEQPQIDNCIDIN